MSGWRAISDPDERIATAVYPLNDYREHDPHNAACWCRPFFRYDVLVHNSMDRREDYENGRPVS